MKTGNRKSVPGKHILSFLRLGVLFAMSLSLTGCLSDYGSSGSRGVSLSQAMESSASGSREPLHGSGSRGTYTPVDASVGVVVTTESRGDTAGPGLWGEDFALQMPMDVAYSVPFNGEFQSITRFTLTPLCAENDRFHLGFFLGGDVVGLKPGTLVDNAIENAGMFELGVAYRRYFNPAHAFVSPYISANIAYQLLFWDYRNPVDVDGEEIQSDVLEGVGGYVGCGIAFNRNKRLSFFGEAGVGGTAFLPQTVRGFDNDVFSNFGYFSVKAGLCIKF
jgi:hypothetical protein